MFVFCGLVPHKRSCRFRSSCAWWKDTAEIPILSRDETTGICQNNNRHLLNLDIPPSLTQTAKKTPENECLEDDSFPFRGAFWPIFKGFVLSNFDSPLLSNRIFGGKHNMVFLSKHLFSASLGRWNHQGQPTSLIKWPSMSQRRLEKTSHFTSAVPCHDS